MDRAARRSLTERAEELHVWMQTLLAPDIVADLAWSPAEDPGSRLAELGARPWQVGAHRGPVRGLGPPGE